MLPDQRNALRSGSDALLAVLRRLIQQAGRALATVVQAAPTLRSHATWRQSILGIGPVTAATLSVALPEVGRCSRQQVVALAGWRPATATAAPGAGAGAPGAAARALAVLYMATLTAVRRNPRLLAAGKPPKVAVAV